MAAHAIVVVDKGKIEIPEKFLNDPRYQEGARLELVPLTKPTSEATLEEQIGDWRRLEGVLGSSSHDPNFELEGDKRSELEGETGWTRL